MSLFAHPKEEDDTTVFVHRLDPEDVLGCSMERPFELDDERWLTAEHYYQAMKYPGRPRFEQILNAPDAQTARKIGRGWLKRPRKNWEDVRPVIMTRAIYTQCRTHNEFARALLDTEDNDIQEMSLYDYYWGRGRDQRGQNQYGKVLMDVRRKLRSEQASSGDQTTTA